MSGPVAFSRCFLAGVVLALTLFLAGCGASAEKAVEKTTEQTQPIDPAGTLSIRNPQGSIRIYGSDDSELKLKATKTAWSNEQLNGITVAISGQPNALSIETNFPPQKKTWRFSDRAGVVDYVVIVPRTIKILKLEIGNGDVSIEGMRGDLRANLVNGAFSERNCFGNAQLSVGNGGLDLLYEKWEAVNFAVDAKIISGNARVFFPKQASFHVVAEATNGTVANHLSDVVERNPRRASKVNMLVGGETRPDIMIHATSGNIEIGRPELRN